MMAAAYGNADFISGGGFVLMSAKNDADGG